MVVIVGDVWVVVGWVEIGIDFGCDFEVIVVEIVEVEGWFDEVGIDVV